MTVPLFGMHLSYSVVQGFLLMFVLVANALGEVRTKDLWLLFAGLQTTVLIYDVVNHSPVLYVGLDVGFILFDLWVWWKDRNDDDDQDRRRRRRVRSWVRSHLPKPVTAPAPQASFRTAAVVAVVALTGCALPAAGTATSVPAAARTGPLPSVVGLTAGLKPLPKLPTSAAVLPNRKLTPGAVGQSDPARVCPHVPAAVEDQRPGTTAKRRVYRAYGVTNPRGWKVDHLVPIEIGGAPADPRDFWPMKVNYGTGTYKDLLENRAHQLVCRALTQSPARARTLMAALQQQFEVSWVDLYRRLAST